MVTATSDSGFSLVELIVAVTLSALLLGAVGLVLITTQRTVQVAATAGVTSRDTQQLTQWLTSDLHSVGPDSATDSDTDSDIDTSAAPFALGCDAEHVADPTSVNLISLRWSDPVTDEETRVAYRRSGDVIVRAACSSAHLSITRIVRRVASAAVTVRASSVTMSVLRRSPAVTTDTLSPDATGTGFVERRIEITVARLTGVAA